MVDPEKETVEQYILRDELYDLLLKSFDGMIESFAVDGFRIPIKSVFDEGENLAALRQIVGE